MSNQFHEGVLRNGDAASGVADAVQAPGRAILAFFRALADVPNELQRMADEYESTRPELAARLRKAARQGWSW